MPERLRKQIVPTGVPSLDKLLGGGIPARQSIVVTGDPGTGKTILCSQVAFAQAKQGKRVVLATLASESQEKLLEELEGFSFFDSDLVGDQIYLVSAYSAIQRGPKDAKDLLIKAMRDRKAEVLFIDGLRSIRDLWQNEAKLRDFLYEVNVGVSQLGAIALFTTEYAVAKLMEYPEATTVDGIVSLSAHRVGGRIARRAQVMKLRGRAHLTSEHLMHITSDGIHMVPRIEETTDAKETFVPTDRRAEFGLPSSTRLCAAGCPRRVRRSWPAPPASARHSSRSSSSPAARVAASLGCWSPTPSPSSASSRGPKASLSTSSRSFLPGCSASTTAPQ